MPFFQKEGEAENQSGRIINNGKQVDEASAAESEAGKHHDLGRQEERNIDYKFIADSEDILILSHKDGYLRVPLEEVEDLAHEVSEVAEVVRLWRRGRT